MKPLLNLLAQKPILAVFELCLRCNSACGYCNLPLNQGRYEMTREEIHRVFASLYDQGIRVIFLQGGEPLLRRDLPEILGDLHGLGFYLTLITNGTRLTASLVERLSALKVSLSVSLDSLDRDRYRQIRGADQLPQVLEGITLLSAYPHPKFITTIVSELNQRDVLQVVRFARTKGFLPVVGAYHWDIERYGRKDRILMYERQTAARVFQQLLGQHLIPRGYLRQYIRDNIRWLKGASLEACDAGRYSIAIDASGNVAPCLALKPAGNVLQSPLNDILARFDRQAVQQCSDRSSCNMLCSRVVGSVFRHPFQALLTPFTARSQRVTL